MNVLIIGAGGKTGRLVVERSFAAGHTVTAFVHSAEDAQKHPFPAGVTVVEEDVQNPSRLRTAMAGCHAVIETIGSPRPYVETHLEANAAKVILDVMVETGVRRLVIVSVLGAGDSKEQAGFFYEHLLMPVFLRGTMVDKNAMEAEVSHSSIDWTLVRPPILSDSDATGSVRIVSEGETARKITRADLAQFLVDQLGSDQYLRQAVTIENA